MNPVWTSPARRHGERAGNRWRSVLSATLVCLAAPAVAEPCGVLILTHQQDAAERQIDKQPPAQVAASLASIVRGRKSGGSCDDLGFLTVQITGAKDDRTPRPKLGYRLSVVGGTPPAGFAPPSDARLALPAAGDASGEVVQLALAWIDRASDNQEPLDFTLAVTAIDLAGNESTPSLVRVRHPGGKPAP